MAHVVTGIDIGAASVKFALIEVGFRHSRSLGTFEEAVPTDPDGAEPRPLADRQREALEAGLARLPQERTVYVAMPGDALAVRVLELPFADARKVDQVVGYELEGQIVHPLDEVVYDHVILDTPGETTEVLAVAARTTDVGTFLDYLNGSGISPRSIFAAPVIYRALQSLRAPATTEDLEILELEPDEKTPAPEAPAAEEKPAPVARLIIDVGAQRTNVAVVQGGDVVFARAILQGGAHLTAAVAKAFQVPLSQAELGKCQRGLLTSARVQPDNDAEARLSDVLHAALAPWLRDLRQTLTSYRARAGKVVIATFTLLGGGGKLRGLVELIEDELGATHVGFTEEPGAENEPPPDPRFAVALATARAGAAGTREIDLRRGPFVYKASFGVVRQKAWHLGGLALALLASVAIDGTMALGRLSQERERLEKELEIATRDLFGVPRKDARAVTAELNKSFKDEMLALPKMTAFDLLDEISRRVPSGERIKLDIKQLDIRPKKVFLKGTIDSVSAVDEMVGKLKEIECFEEIQKGAITEVSGGAKQFTLTIASKCP